VLMFVLRGGVLLDKVRCANFQAFESTAIVDIPSSVTFVKFSIPSKMCVSSAQC